MNPSLECELTRVQMKRYLGGEELPEPLMEELEQHVHACASCRHYLDTQKLKLASKLSGAKAEKVKAPVEPKGPKDSDVFHEPKQKLFTPKTLGLAAALALVLFAMSAVAKDPTIMFGRKASTALSAADKEKQTGEAGSDEVGADSSKSDEEDASHSKVGEIMTGESVKKDLENQKAEDAKAADHSDPHAADGHTEADPEKTAKPTSEPDPHDAAGHSEAKPDTAHSDKPADSHEPKQPEAKPTEAKPEVKKASDMSLVVAEHGKTKKEPAPKPRPEATKTAPRKTSTASKRRSSVKRSTPKRAASPRRSSPAKSSGSGSIKVYDSQGRPVN